MNRPGYRRAAIDCRLTTGQALRTLPVTHVPRGADRSGSRDGMLRHCPNLDDPALSHRTTVTGVDARWVWTRRSSSRRTTLSMSRTQTSPWRTPHEDTVPPEGTISIEGGAAYSSSTAVAVAVPATDSGTGMSEVALSNDGTTWAVRPYDANQQWGLPAANGTRRVWAKWKDAAGNWSTPASDTILLDTVAPTATGPSWRLGNAGSTLSSGAIPTRLAWTGADATAGIDHYELAQSTDGAA
jgi:hypothetical protein